MCQYLALLAWIGAGNRDRRSSDTSLANEYSLRQHGQPIMQAIKYFDSHISCRDFSVMSATTPMPHVRNFP